MGGSIQYDKKSRRYYIDIYWQKQHHKIWSNPHTGEVFYDRRQAERILHRIQTEVDEKTFHPRFWKPDSPLLVQEYYIEWLNAISVSKATIQNYTSYFTVHLIPLAGTMDIRHIRHKHLSELYKQLLTRLSTKGAHSVMSALKAMLRWAYKSEDIKYMPPFPSMPIIHPEITYLTLDQQNAVLSHIPDRDRPLFEFAMEYGLRTQEVTALQKDCITDTHVIIKRSWSRYELHEHTKTKLIRYEPLTDYARKILASVPKHLSPFVFVRANGKHHTNRSINVIWQKACKAAGITIKLQNAFRHSLGCQLLDQGETLDLVRDVLGHTDNEMTRRYAKRNPANIREALERRRNIIPIKKINDV